jgi:putative membrane protein
MDKFLRAALPLALAIAGLTAAPVRAEVTEHSAEGIVSDNEFLRRALSGGNAEVQLGLVAQNKAMDSDVRLLADQLVADHGRSNSILTTIARDKHIDVPADLAAPHKTKLDALNSRTGADFDLEYLEGVRVDQQAMVGLFSTEANTGSDPDMRRFAAGHLPIMQAHLERVVALQKALKAEKR